MSAILPALATVFTSIGTTAAAIGSSILTGAAAIFTGGAAAGGAGLLSSTAAAGAAGSVTGTALAGGGGGGIFANLLGGLGFSAESGFGSVLSGALSKGVQGALTGGIVSKLSGGSFADGAKAGGIGGIVTGGLGALSGSAPGAVTLGRADPSRTATQALSNRLPSTSGLGGGGAVGTAAAGAGPGAGIGGGAFGGLKDMLGDGFLGNVIAGAADGYSKGKLLEEQAEMMEQQRIDAEERRSARYAGVGDSVRLDPREHSLSVERGTQAFAAQGGGEDDPSAADRFKIEKAAERYRRRAQQRAPRSSRVAYNPATRRIEPV